MSSPQNSKFDFSSFWWVDCWVGMAWLLWHPSLSWPLAPKTGKLECIFWLQILPLKLLLEFSLSDSFWAYFKWRLLEFCKWSWVEVLLVQTDPFYIKTLRFSAKSGFWIIPKHCSSLSWLALVKMPGSFLKISSFCLLLAIFSSEELSLVIKSRWLMLFSSACRWYC